ncbi:MAG TPA: MFS transporter [Kiritimatiellia bacterium]|nr:MFS transporter [Kiritimatiellia bacterium]HRU70166.1 MFS transporter [Kiritimatiellia bacterium]
MVPPASGLCNTGHWPAGDLCGAVNALFPKMAEALHPGTAYAFFCGMMIQQLLWIKSFVSETKGIPLEQMQSRLGIDT